MAEGLEDPRTKLSPLPSVVRQAGELVGAMIASSRKRRMVWSIARLAIVVASWRGFTLAGAGRRAPRRRLREDLWSEVLQLAAGVGFVERDQPRQRLRVRRRGPCLQVLRDVVL